MATWVAASYVLGREVPTDEPYPHIHDRTATGQITGRTYQIWRRDCAACAEPNQRGNR